MVRGGRSRAPCPGLMLTPTYGQGETCIEWRSAVRRVTGLVMLRHADRYLGHQLYRRHQCRPDRDPRNHPAHARGGGLDRTHGGMNMASIEIKRVYEPCSRSDGERILVDRLWPRGLRKEAARIDLWKKDIAPTPSLRIWFDHRADRFNVFRKRYREELKANPAVTEILEAIGRRRATLLYAARDATVNHAVVLAEFLEKARSRNLR